MKVPDPSYKLWRKKIYGLLVEVGRKKRLRQRAQAWPGARGAVVQRCDGDGCLFIQKSRRSSRSNLKSFKIIDEGKMKNQLVGNRRMSMSWTCKHARTASASSRAHDAAVVVGGCSCNGRQVGDAAATSARKRPARFQVSNLVPTKFSQILERTLNQTFPKTSTTGFELLNKNLSNFQLRKSVRVFQNSSTGGN